ncbi:uncharacterized protein zgc:162608 [Boleophthalmus pectinirostris]|uniref:uncharacterized protein zgc:162608 n=1 Tax=Boleophthalmus pectinirostris TaxID=150288 RepID=UPI000A1C3B43|nr:uncharacterized protein zgc:162608 [Boleophthalmus pectinirostris]
MLIKVMLFVSFLTVSANPLHRNTREAPWADSRINQAHDKTEVSKSMDSSYKSHIDSNNLYSQEEEGKHPVAAEVQHKLSLESERLRVRLHQELAELREKLSPSTHVSSTLSGLRERLAPLMLQLQSSLSSSTQELCIQVRVHLQSMETAETPADDGQKILQRISQTLDQSSSKMADIVRDFYSEASKVVGQFKDSFASEGEIAHSEMWQKFSSRLSQEVGTLRVEAQSRAVMVLEELTSLQTASQGFEANMSAKMEGFCLNADLQVQLFAAQMERLFVDLEEELLAHTDSSQSTSSSSLHSGSLQEDFSLKLSSLIQDILHSVQ